ncbi:ABC transporter permease [Actinoplanes sichuanensis]|uniref:ABC transporter permease n=1 Tax=Actinoplanes sichuanensis TaxID=512349 RepID=A0ABW4ACE0_9ACTN|nr:ABC transporter permease [Actinoplanes sichuanensis]BEL10047.1 ABC transporter permease [Actinoplanes sichuanensis]
MTATTAPSAYPRTVDELIPHARDLANRLGTLPSRNQLMKAFKVGGPKANALLAALTQSPAAPVEPEPVEPPPADDTPEVELEPIAAEPVAEPAVTPAPPVLPSIHPADEMAWVGITRPPAEPVEPPAPEPTLVEPVAEPEPKRRRPVVWPVLILCLPAFVAIWGGWVEMGRLTGFGMVTLLPGISDFQINTAITLPIGMETLAAYALYVWLSGMVTGSALRFAKWCALTSLTLGALGQIAYHLMAAWGWTSAPWPITAAVACIPVAVLGMGAALAHLMHKSR